MSCSTLLWIALSGFFLSTLRLMSMIMKLRKTSTDHFPSRFDNFPLEVDIVRIKEAQGAAVVLKPRSRKDLVQQNLVAVGAINVNVLAVSSDFS